MPMIKMSSGTAVENRKGNAAATWGNRNDPNRVEPIARPEFTTPFQLEEGEKYSRSDPVLPAMLKWN